MTERNFVHFLRRHEIAAKKAGDGLAVVFGDGRIQMKSPFAGCVPLPTERDNRVTVAEKPSVTSVVGEIFIAAIDEREDARKAAVGIFEEQRAIAFGWIFGANSDEVCGKFDFAILEIDGVCQVDDGSVVDVVDGDGEKDSAGDAFIGASVAKRFSTENVHTGSDFDASDVREERWNCEKEEERGENRAAGEASCGKFHARQNSTE